MTPAIDYLLREIALSGDPDDVHQHLVRAFMATAIDDARRQAVASAPRVARPIVRVRRRRA